MFSFSSHETELCKCFFEEKKHSALFLSANKALSVIELSLSLKVV